jgi:hypothetical protein
MDLVRNASDDAVTVESVKLLDAQGVELVGSYMVASDASRPAVGTLRGWPPATPGPPVRLRPLGVIPPGEMVNVVLHLQSQPDHLAAELDGYVVRYEVGGRQFEARSLVGVVMKRSC